MARVRIGIAGTCAAASFAAVTGLLLATPAPAIQDGDGGPPPKEARRVEDTLVPIPSWSKDVADNGCRLHTTPSPVSKDALVSLTDIPFWVLIEHEVGHYSVRATLDPPETFAKSLEPLDAERRTLTLLHVLWDGLGRDGLHTFFYLDAGQNAPAVRDALEAAGFAREHAVFTQAMALFGATYPLDNEQRAKVFGYATPSQELNDLDRRLLALSGQFGSRETWTDIIVGYVNRTPKLWQRVEAGRKTLGEMGRFEHLTSTLLAPVDFWKPYAEVQRKLAAYTEPQRTLAILAAFNDQFENGGVHQVFYNAEGSIAPDVQEALAGIGLAPQADLIGRAIAMFKTPYPRDTDERRETHFHDHDGWNGFDRQLSELTDAFYALDGGPQVLHMGGDLQIQGGPGLRYAMLAFAKHHNMLPC